MLYIIISFLILAADFVTKQLVMHNARLGTIFFSIPGLLHLTYVKNTGAAFSMLQGKMVLLSVISVAFLIGVIVYVIVKKPKNPLLRASLALLFAGAAGNAIDRIFYGFVVDFIEVGFVTFPVFNIADIAVTAGIILIMIYILFFDKGGKKGKQK